MALITSRVAQAGCALFAALALTLPLAGCGGGGGDSGVVGVSSINGINGVAFDIGVNVNGQPFPNEIFPGAPTTVALAPGQSVELDASEPVVWAFSINNSPLFTSGTTVISNGLAIMQTDLTPSRVAIDTAVVGPLLLPIVITLTATSTFDAAEVATVFLQIG
jgi:hypothetical protein